MWENVKGWLLNWCVLNHLFELIRMIPRCGPHVASHCFVIWLPCTIANHDTVRHHLLSYDCCSLEDGIHPSCIAGVPGLVAVTCVNCNSFHRQQLYSLKEFALQQGFKRDRTFALGIDATNISLPFGEPMIPSRNVAELNSK